LVAESLCMLLDDRDISYIYEWENTQRAHLAYCFRISSRPDM
jgi:hypothetical protein